MNTNKNYINIKEEDKRIKNLYTVFQQLNAEVKIDDRLKRRTRNGGYISWPKNNSDISGLARYGN